MCFPAFLWIFKGQGLVSIEFSLYFTEIPGGMLKKESKAGEGGICGEVLF